MAFRVDVGARRRADIAYRNQLKAQAEEDRRLQQRQARQDRKEKAAAAAAEKKAKRQAAAAAAAAAKAAKNTMAAKSTATAASNSAKIDAVLKALDAVGLNVGDIGRTVAGGTQPRIPDVAAAAAGSAAESAKAADNSQVYLLVGAGLLVLLLSKKGVL